ncbi:cold-shock protein [Mucilaginibacter lappiensis]|uniref:Cold shock CspA family protein n=1 Tax=Mucilaginibacter lappiensis TaxID=354630 RepID=A0A1N6SXQ2_9SPHI|nr:cold shock domain-containing protein [Mucilaginibacter lappiensis]MBB6108246.1 cold shock CspA family protein [Mucilaginibacter lappiensis]MBB6130387.1 cold shock CspA family protein [Mucilaginibacter lappiensis]SIQ45784.1 cold-shock DNA-binding protein family [Mucilaginibacter lappiensis]
MGRSTETFGKKEKEKARLKKAKDKKEKAEERKANAGTGKSLEDMMAYIDEHGNITSTPPDPSRKIKVNSEDIQIGIAKRQDLPHDTVRNGVVSFFNEAKGYGFIRDLQTEESIFVHINALTGPLKENNLVTFETEQGLKGLSAINVKLK